MSTQNRIRTCAAAAFAMCLIAASAAMASVPARAAEPQPVSRSESAPEGALRPHTALTPLALHVAPWAGGHRGAAESLADALLVGAVEPLSPAPGILQFGDEGGGQPAVLPRLGSRPREEDRPSWPLWTGLLLTGAALAIQFDGLESDQSRPTKDDLQSGQEDGEASSAPLTETRQSSDDSDNLGNASLTIGAVGLVLLAYYFLGDEPAPAAGTAQAGQDANGSLQLALAADEAAVGWGWRW